MIKLAAIFSLAAVAATASSVQAQDLRLYGGLRLGFGGELESEPEDGGNSVSDDLTTTLGGQAGLEYLLLEHLSLGGELRLAGISTDGRDDADQGGDVFIDVVAKPKVIFALGDALELYGTLPFGITFVNVDKDVEEALEPAELSVGPGFTLGFGGGATYFLTDTIGINGEAAYLLYWLGSEAEAGNFTVKADNSLGQFTLFANLVLAL